MDIKIGDMVATWDGDATVEAVSPDGTVTVRYENFEQGWYDADKFEPASFHPYDWREIREKSQH